MSTSAHKNSNPLPPFPVRFYNPTNPVPDPHNRTLPSILSWPDSALEYSHNYIQYLFPLPERSPINPSAPIINETTFTTFRSRPELREQLRLSLVRILRFYGFELVRKGLKKHHDDDDEVETSAEREEGWQVIRGLNFPQASKNWVTQFNHNHLRITRILRCCRVLGLQEEAKAFHAALVDVAEEKGGSNISQRTMIFWRRAAERPLYLAPEDEDEEGIGRGKEWLY
ncbi:MAG: hypothetical protein LQ343_006457 [Gyalolechia ehrenbergii]|nr:MAG: hypothetical protein LQ343_006457 [Gyalolechia ehrenbergii]